MPDVGQRVAERVQDRAPRIGAEAIRRRQTTPDVPSDRKALPGEWRRKPWLRRALSACAAASTGGTLIRQRAAKSRRRRAGRLAAGDEPRHGGERKACRRERRFGPSRAPTSSQERPGRVRHVLNRFPVSRRTKPCLGKRHGCGSGRRYRFVPTNPKHLRSGETRHGAVASDGAKVGAAPSRRPHRLRPAVVPENYGRQTLRPGRAALRHHLAGKPNPATAET